MSSLEILHDRLVRTDATRRHVYLEKLRRFAAAFELGHLPLAGLCALAGDAFQEYATETLADLLRAGAGRPDSERDRWIAREYDAAVSRAGAEIRDAVPDATARHAVAQVLQQRMLAAIREEGHKRTQKDTKADQD